MKRQWTRRQWLASAAARAAQAVAVGHGLAACGGSGTDGTGPSSLQVNVGALKGLADTSVTVNNVSYEVWAGTSVQDGFGQPAPLEALRLGMWLEVVALVSEDESSALAQTIRIRPAARGVVAAVGATVSTVTVLQSTATVDSASTVLDGVLRAGALVPGDVIEVHGPLGNGAGAFEATRIEKLSLGEAPKPVELRGRVSALDLAAQKLTVGRQVVDFSGATLLLRNALANRQVVRVRAMTGPQGTQPWRVERLTTDAVLPQNLGFLYAEGVTTDWESGPRFNLEDLPVDATAATNRGLITADGQRVAIIGSVVEGVVKAKAAALILPGQPVLFVLSGVISGLLTAGRLRVRGVLVDTSAATFTGGSEADLADGRRARVTGIIDGQRLVASRFEFL